MHSSYHQPGCPDAADNLHFNADGYKELGKRFAEKMLSLMGQNVTELK